MAYPQKRVLLDTSMIEAKTKRFNSRLLLFLKITGAMPFVAKVTNACWQPVQGF